jgi:RHS repeat-associated protein
MNRLIACLIALLLTNTVWSNTAHAASTTLTPSADAFVQAGTNAGKNYGTLTSLRARTSATAASNYDSYLTFNTGSVPNIINAKLRLYAKLSASGSVSTGAYAVASTTWSETGITWNNKPARGALLGSVTVNSTAYAYKDIDVTAYVQGEYAAGRKVVSFAYHNGANTSIYITGYSRNSTSANKPQLLITYDLAPTVSLSAPAANSVYTAPATIAIGASAADSDGSIAKVDFYNGATLLGTATAAPYTYTWANVPAGSYSLSAKATDNLGVSTTAAPINISVNPAPNVPPTVSLTTPANGASYSAPASIGLGANATDSDGSIASVAFYNGTTLLGTATAAPYTYTWSNVPAGSYSVSAIATDNANASTTASPVNITVNPNQPPSVSLLAPSVTDSFTAPASFSIVANATDSDGSIAKVEFYNGSTLLGSASQTPYQYDWLNVPAGSYSLSAKAYDNANASTTSSTVNITVNEPLVGPGIYYIYADHLNTPRVITDTANTPVWRWDSDPFGTDVPVEDPSGGGRRFSYNLRFPGQYYDQETGLHYNYFRDYDPGTGRYVQSDPIGLNGGLNTYAYVNGNPVSRKDPKGLDGFDDLYQYIQQPGFDPARPPDTRPGDTITLCRLRCSVEFFNPLPDMASEKGAEKALGEVAAQFVKKFNKGKAAYDLGKCLHECQEQFQSCER